MFPQMSPGGKKLYHSNQIESFVKRGSFVVASIWFCWRTPTLVLTSVRWDEGNYTRDYALLVFNLMNSLVVGCIQWISINRKEDNNEVYHSGNVVEMIHILILYTYWTKLLLKISKRDTFATFQREMINGSKEANSYTRVQFSRMERLCNTQFVLKFWESLTICLFCILPGNSDC